MNKTRWKVKRYCNGCNQNIELPNSGLMPQHKDSDGKNCTGPRVHGSIWKQCLDCIGNGCINCNFTGKVEV